MEHTKTILAMIGLVAIGFAGGFFTHAQLTRHHLKQVVKERTIPGFEERLFRVVRLTDEQKEKLSPVVKEFAKDLHRIHSHTRIDRKEVFDSLQVVLEDELTDKQMERFRRFIHRHLMERGPHEKKMHHREKKSH